MEIRLNNTGAIVSDTEFRAAHPNTSFPAQLSNELLNGFGADVVLNGPTPSAGRYQTVVRDGVEEINGKWFTRFVTMDMGDDAKAATDAQRKASIRSERNRKLVDSDWTQLIDSPVNQAGWAAYRQALRDMTDQTGFPWEVVWPQEP